MADTDNPLVKRVLDHLACLGDPDELLDVVPGEARFLPELNVSPKDVVIPKTTYSAFHKTGLEEKLEEHGIQDLVIGGVMTNLCCETTARDAFVRDYRVFFLVDGTSTVNEDFHLATLKNLSYGFATLLTCDRFIKTLKP